MSDNVGNKWEWIAMKCSEIGYPSASNVAEAIGNTERKIYPDMTSWIWAKHMNDVNLQWIMTKDKATLLIAVARFKPFNVGCIRNDEHCDDCKFGHRVGPCAKSGSITYFWERTLLKDYGMDIDEKAVGLLLVAFEVWFT